MKKNNESDQKLKTLNRLDLFFILAGLVEVFILTFLTHNVLSIIAGLVTIIPAYLALKQSKLKWNYFVAIWALLKYNPIGLALIFFVISDLPMNLSDFAFYGVGAGMLIVAISSFVIGIIILVKTSKYFKNQSKTN